MTSNTCNDKYLSHNFNSLGYQSGLGFLKKVKELLCKRNLDKLYQCDSPTESKGNCYPCSLMQQLHRPDIYCTLTNEMKSLCENCHTLRWFFVLSIGNFRWEWRQQNHSQQSFRIFDPLDDFLNYQSAI